MINKLYELLGKIFENAQYIEWNVALIVSKSHNMTADDLFEKMQDMTMGQIVVYAKNVEFFGDDDISKLSLYFCFSVLTLNTLVALLMVYFPPLSL